MTAPRRYRLDIAYDGTAYAGWQIQPNADTVQARIEERLRQLVNDGQLCKLHACGRTDRGVHARHQVAHVDLSCRIPPECMARAVNAGLPSDIRVMKARAARPDFHARRSAKAREYRYFVVCSEVLPPHLNRYALAVPRHLDREAMIRAAAFFTGRHDFSSFSANPQREVPDARRTIGKFVIGGTGRHVVFQVRGDGFLYKMVRGMVGFLLRVGEGAEQAESVADILRSSRRTARVPTAPSRGLFLWRIFY